MVVAKDTTDKKSNETAGESTVDPSTVPGVHVVRADGVLLGTYQHEVDAQAFIDGHVVPNGQEASIVHGPASIPAE